MPHLLPHPHLTTCYEPPSPCCASARLRRHERPPSSSTSPSSSFALSLSTLSLFPYDATILLASEDLARSSRRRREGERLLGVSLFVLRKEGGGAKRGERPKTEGERASTETGTEIGENLVCLGGRGCTRRRGLGGSRGSNGLCETEMGRCENGNQYFRGSDGFRRGEKHVTDQSRDATGPPWR